MSMQPLYDRIEYDNERTDDQLQQDLRLIAADLEMAQQEGLEDGLERSILIRKTAHVTATLAVAVARLLKRGGA